MKVKNMVVGDKMKIFNKDIVERISNSRKRDKTLESCDLIIHSNYIELVGNENVYGIQMKISGNGVLNRVDDSPNCICEMRNNIFVMLFLNQTNLPQTILYYNGNIEVGSVVVCDNSGTEKYIVPSINKEDSPNVKNELIKIDSDTEKIINKRVTKKKKKKKKLILLPQLGYARYKAQLLDDASLLLDVKVNLDKDYNYIKGFGTPKFYSDINKIRRLVNNVEKGLASKTTAKKSLNKIIKGGY